jgi:hypothetical protein
VLRLVADAQRHRALLETAREAIGLCQQISAHTRTDSEKKARGKDVGRALDAIVDEAAKRLSAAQRSHELSEMPSDGRPQRNRHGISDLAGDF